MLENCNFFKIYFQRYLCSIVFTKCAPDCTIFYKTFRTYTIYFLMAPLMDDISHKEDADFKMTRDTQFKSTTFVLSMPLDIEATINKNMKQSSKWSEILVFKLFLFLEEFFTARILHFDILRNSHGLVLFLSQHENQAVIWAVSLRRG